jgi:hypothetical protein
MSWKQEIPFVGSFSEDDLLNVFEGRDDYEEICLKIDKLTDEQKEKIANNVSDSIMHDWSAILYDCAKEVLNVR